MATASEYETTRKELETRNLLEANTTIWRTRPLQSGHGLKLQNASTSSSGSEHLGAMSYINVKNDIQT
ncbi:hypothetical protein ACU8KH_04993 [Lachancea thermotolerans]